MKIELAFYALMLIIGGAWIADVLFDGGPLWKLLGFVLVVANFNKFEERWRQL